MSQTDQSLIEDAFDRRDHLNQDEIEQSLRPAVARTLDALENGSLRVAQPGSDGWQVNQWAKKAVLLFFRMHDNQPIDGGYTRFFDKVPLRFADAMTDPIQDTGARFVPPAMVRRGAFVGRDAVIMPSYINIGAHVGAGSMIDTWATVGSCAQIGERVHISGGAGIGGVLEPLQANPTIIEDNCFIGARSEIVEGVIVEKGAVISMGVFIGQSTPIYDRESGEIIRGRVPAGAVVVPGSLPAKDGTHSLYCAVIVKRVDEKTRAKVGINELLRSVPNQ